MRLCARFVVLRFWYGICMYLKALPEHYSDLCHDFGCWSRAIRWSASIMFIWAFGVIFVNTLPEAGRRNLACIALFAIAFVLAVKIAPIDCDFSESDSSLKYYQHCSPLKFHFAKRRTECVYHRRTTSPRITLIICISKDQFFCCIFDILTGLIGFNMVV